MDRPDRDLSAMSSPSDEALRDYRYSELDRAKEMFKELEEQIKQYEQERDMALDRLSTAITSRKQTLDALTEYIATLTNYLSSTKAINAVGSTR